MLVFSIFNANLNSNCFFIIIWYDMGIVCSVNFAVVILRKMHKFVLLAAGLASLKWLFARAGG